MHHQECVGLLASDKCSSSRQTLESFNRSQHQPAVRALTPNIYPCRMIAATFQHISQVSSRSAPSLSTSLFLSRCQHRSAFNPPRLLHPSHPTKGPSLVLLKLNSTRPTTARVIYSEATRSPFLRQSCMKMQNSFSLRSEHQIHFQTDGRKADLCLHRKVASTLQLECSQTYVVRIR